MMMCFQLSESLFDNLKTGLISAKKVFDEPLDCENAAPFILTKSSFELLFVENSSQLK